MKTLYHLLLLSLLLAVNVTQSISQTSNWKASDIINQKSASDLQFSPDGNSIVWVKTKPNREKDRDDRDLYLTLLNAKENGEYKTIPLTRGDEKDYNPLFSSTGETIYFLSSRDDGEKIWALSAYGGEPYEVMTFETGISDLQRIGKHKLAFKSNEGPTLHEQELKDEEDNTIVVEDTAHFKASRVYSFDTKMKEVERLTNNEFPVREFEVSPDGNWLVTSHTMSPDYGVDANPKLTYYLWNLQTGTKQEIFKQGYQTPGNFKFTDDSQGFYSVSVKSSDPQWNGAGITLLHYFSLENKEAKEVPIDWDWGLGSGFDVLGNDVIAGLANGTTNILAYFEKDDAQWSKKTVDAEKSNEHVTVISASEDNQQVAYVYSTSSTLPEYRIAQLDKNRRSVELAKGSELFNLNEHLENKHIAKTEIVSWTGSLGDEVTGILHYPKNYEEGRRYPLIVSIHGGPSGVDMDRWDNSWAYFPQIYSQKGAFVLFPNYHGSGNHGLEFTESIKGHYYEYEIPDIIAGIDMLDNRGMIDRDSLGVKGWSNGAILTTKLTIQYPDMFKVAAPGAGDVNWTSDYGTCSFGVSFDQSYFEGAPWDNTDGQIFNEMYVQKSPLFEMEKVRTPTIIFHGSKDRAVPRDQGWEYYRALQQIGKAPVRFLWFPNQPHSLQKITHRTRKIKEEIRWFDKYLFGTYEPENESFKEESPIAELLKKEKAKTTEGLYGQTQNGILIPETVLVKKDSIAIGRFEITNAQYAEFDKQYTYPTLKANYPVTGISIEQARNYTKWLSNQTGKSFRLPSKQEAEKLHEQAMKVATSENTLNFWAGYEITVDEISEFRKKLDQLNQSLLKEAGSFDAVKVGNAWTYDLGGNAAEWYDGSKNKPIYGYSASSYVDKHKKTANAPDKYIGFRVINDLAN